MRELHELCWTTLTVPIEAFLHQNLLTAAGPSSKDVRVHAGCVARCERQAGAPTDPAWVDHVELEFWDSNAMRGRTLASAAGIYRVGHVVCAVKLAVPAGLEPHVRAQLLATSAGRYVSGSDTSLGIDSIEFARPERCCIAPGSHEFETVREGSN